MARRKASSRIRRYELQFLIDRSNSKAYMLGNNVSSEVVIPPIGHGD